MPPVTFPVEIIVDKHDATWFVGTMPKFGLTAYDTTPFGAFERIGDMLDALLDSLDSAGGFDAVVERLSRAGVKWESVSEQAFLTHTVTFAGYDPPARAGRATMAGAR